MQQGWYDDCLGLKSLLMVVFFTIFPLVFKVFIDIHDEYAHYLICIAGHGMKGTCLAFNLIPCLAFYNKYKLRYD